MKKSKGFTLLEMVVVITIVSILTIVGKVSYDISVEKAKYSEFIPTITAIQNAQAAYYVEHQRYADSIFDLGLEIEGERISNFHPLTSNTGFKGNGDAIRTKNFIYGTYVFEEKKVKTGEREYKPYIHAYRYTKRYSNGNYNWNDIGVSLYNIEDPTKQMDFRSVTLQSRDRVKLYVFKKVLKSMVNNHELID